MVKHRLSRRLGPRAKRRLLRSREGETVLVQAEVTAAADRDALRRGIEGLGGEVRGPVDRGRVLIAAVPAERLGDAAELEGVVYLEASSPMRRGSK